MSQLSGKNAIVTGASRGIGAAIARELARRGAAVAINYAKSPAPAEALADEINKAGGRAFAFHADLSKLDTVEASIGEAAKKLGPVDILINNAGWGEFIPVSDISVEHYRSQFDLNVGGLLFTTKAALAHWRPNAGGAIVNISSVSSAGMANAAVYSGTKAAVNAITVAAAAELGPRGIRVNAVLPGPVDTDLMRGAVGEEHKAAMMAQTPLGRIGNVDDIALAVAGLVGDDSRWITGQTIWTAGGMRI